MENKIAYHIPVLRDACVDALNIHPDGVYVDVTFGGGGHSRAIFERLSEKGRLIAFDQDPDARINVWDAPNFHFVPANFAFLQNHLRMLGFPKVDGILADFGVSSHQFDEESRGFSIRSNAQLDMRMNQSGDLSARQVVNEYSEEELTRIFKEYADLPNARKLAVRLITQRESKSLETTQELIDIIQPLAPRFKEHKFYAQVFQAIRIEVNGEMDVLKKFLLQTAQCLNPKGRLVALSYHSLEDRLVKNWMKRGSLDGSITKDFFGNVIKPFTEINRHPILPTDEEMEDNPRARSAKLRIAERNDG
jgi:16S rRNA (cytosine1402-N4)-methyltransferase